MRYITDNKKMHRMKTLPSIFTFQFGQRTLWAFRLYNSIGFDAIFQVHFLPVFRLVVGCFHR